MMAIMQATHNDTTARSQYLGVVGEGEGVASGQ